jgi:hypothetical protein
LKPRTHRDGEANACLEDSNLLLFAFSSPHFSATGQDIPDFFDRPMRNGQRSLACCKLKVSHGAAAHGEQNSYC